MLISHKHKFITIDIPKTATRSLRETLLPQNIIDMQEKYAQYKKQNVDRLRIDLIKKLLEA